MFFRNLFCGCGDYDNAHYISTNQMMWLLSTQQYATKYAVYYMVRSFFFVLLLKRMKSCILYGPIAQRISLHTNF